MMRDITLGQYYPVPSVLHKLDPRTKLFATLILIIALFTADNPVCYVLAAVFLFLVIALSKVPVGHILKGLKPVIFLLPELKTLVAFHERGAEQENEPAARFK